MTPSPFPDPLPLSEWNLPEEEGPKGAEVMTDRRDATPAWGEVMHKVLIGNEVDRAIERLAGRVTLTQLLSHAAGSPEAAVRVAAWVGRHSRGARGFYVLATASAVVDALTALAVEAEWDERTWRAECSGYEWRTTSGVTRVALITDNLSRWIDPDTLAREGIARTPSALAGRCLAAFVMGATQGGGGIPFWMTEGDGAPVSSPRVPGGDQALWSLRGTMIHALSGWVLGAHGGRCAPLDDRVVPVVRRWLTTQAHRTHPQDVPVLSGAAVAALDRRLLNTHASGPTDTMDHHGNGRRVL